MQFMALIHTGDAGVCKQSFPAANLSLLCQCMQIGQYYQPLPCSSSADALIRCTSTVMCQFQFKNVNHPLTLAEIAEEIPKCHLPSDWVNYLIIVGINGHGLGDGSDHVLVEGGTTVVVLSKASVERFTGCHVLSSIAPGATMLSEHMGKLTVTTPLKMAVARSASSADAP
jgi:hypothetical protein